MTHTTAADTPLTDESRISLIQTAINSSWLDYYQLLSRLPPSFGLAPSLKLLNIADQLMNQSSAEEANDLTDSSLAERYLIGGIEDSQTAKQFSLNPQLLGSMQGFASFKKVLKSDPQGLAKLVKIIPAYGRIDGWHFTQFIDAYQSLFADNGFKQTHLFPATRLLSMKRPDQFVAISAESVEFVCHAFEVKILKKQDFQRYWDDIIVPLQKAPWFTSEQPEENNQAPIFRARMALFERFICQPSEDHLLSDTVDRAASDRPSEESIDSSSANMNAPSYSPEPTTKPVIKKVSQPKKMTIEKKKSAKVNKNAATKLMSQYYFANREKFAKVNMGDKRDKIIARLIDGESVEEAFNQVL